MIITKLLVCQNMFYNIHIVNYTNYSQSAFDFQFDFSFDSSIDQVNVTISKYPFEGLKHT